MSTGLEQGLFDPRRDRLVEDYARQAVRRQLRPGNFNGNLLQMGVPIKIADWSKRDDWEPKLILVNREMNRFFISAFRSDIEFTLRASSLALGLLFAQPVNEGFQKGFLLTYIHFDSRPETLRNLPPRARGFGIREIDLIYISHQQRIDLDRVLQPITARMFETQTRRSGFSFQNLLRRLRGE